MDIILASQSPRRKELLRQIVPEFRVVPSGFDESALEEPDPLRFAIAAAEAKAREVGERFPSAVIIAADTVVNLGREILGKPRDAAEARVMLGKLSGSRHRVITGVILFKKDEDRLATGYAISRVTFRELTPEQIEAYLAAGEYLDKAGSYAVQEVGDTFVERLDGDYDNVVGLPVRCVRKMLDEFLPPEHSVTITDVALPHDWGVGRIDRAVIFVPGAVLGDKVRVAVAKKERRHLFGRIIRVEERSPDRAAPGMPALRRLRGMLLPEPRVLEAARGQGEVPYPDARKDRRGEARRRREGADRPVAGALLLPQQDGICLHRPRGQGPAGPQGKGFAARPL